MKLTFCLASIAGIVGLTCSAPAKAGKGDDAWASCLWQKVPTSANNWVLGPETGDRQSLGSIRPEFALMHRLEAACYSALTPVGKDGPPNFKAKKVRAALLSTKPQAIGVDTIDPLAFVCRRYFLNDVGMKNPAGFRWGFGKDTSKAQFGSMTYFFAAQGGGSVGLPDVGGLEKCEYIQSDGTLRDA
jgi:hypothetical protein